MNSKVKINKSAVRREKQDARKKATNHWRLHTMKTYIKRARAKGSVDAFKIAQTHIARCVKHRVIHANAGARLTSRLSSHIGK